MDLGDTIVESGFGAKSKSEYAHRHRDGDWGRDLPIYDVQPWSIAQTGIGASTARYEPIDNPNREKEATKGRSLLGMELSDGALVMLFIMALIVIGYLLMRVSSLSTAMSFMIPMVQTGGSKKKASV